MTLICAALICHVSIRRHLESEKHFNLVLFMKIKPCQDYEGHDFCDAELELQHDDEIFQNILHQQ